MLCLELDPTNKAASSSTAKAVVAQPEEKIGARARHTARLVVNASGAGSDTIPMNPGSITELHARAFINHQIGCISWDDVVARLNLFGVDVPSVLNRLVLSGHGDVVNDVLSQRTITAIQDAQSLANNRHTAMTVADNNARAARQQFVNLFYQITITNDVQDRNALHQQLNTVVSQIHDYEVQAAHIRAEFYQQRVRVSFLTHLFNQNLYKMPMPPPAPEGAPGPGIRGTVAEYVTDYGGNTKIDEFQTLSQNVNAVLFQASLMNETEAYSEMLFVLNNDFEDVFADVLVNAEPFNLLTTLPQARQAQGDYQHGKVPWRLFVVVRALKRLVATVNIRRTRTTVLDNNLNNVIKDLLAYKLPIYTGQGVATVDKSLDEWYNTVKDVADKTLHTAAYPIYTSDQMSNVIATEISAKMDAEAAAAAAAANAVAPGDGAVAASSS